MPAAAHAAFDLGDRHQVARAQVSEQRGDGGFSGQDGGLGPVRGDLGQVDVGDEVVGVAAAEHDDLDRVIGLGALNQ